MPTRTLPRRAATAAAGLTLVLGLAACSASGGSDEAVMDSAGVTEQGAADATLPEEAASMPSEAAADASATNETAVVEREIVVTGNVALTSQDPSATVSDLVQMVEQAGGRVEQLNETPSTEDEPGYASATVRIPADRTTSAIEAFSDLATVQHVDIGKDDVTSQGQNLDARIAALTTSTDRLTELLASAGSTEDLLDVERELATRQAELDSLVAQRESLSDQVSMSTIYVDITAQTAPVAAPSSGFTDGLSTGWSALSATVQTVVLVLGVALPWLALAAVGYVVFRLIRRRLRTHASPAGPGGSNGTDGTAGPGDDGIGPDAPAPGAEEREPQLTR